MSDSDSISSMSSVPAVNEMLRKNRDKSSCASWLVPLLIVAGIALAFYLWYNHSSSCTSDSNNNSNGVMVISNMTNNNSNSSNNNGQVIELTGRQLLDASKKSPIVVALFLQGCGPCNSTKPAYHEAAKSSKRQLYSMHAHSDGAMEVLKALGIKGFPTICVVSNGKVLSEYSGDRSSNSLASWASNV